MARGPGHLGPRKEKFANDYLPFEKGVVLKEPGGRVRVALIWPGSYATGMASLGFLSVYSILNANPRIYAERFFQPDPGRPPLSVETKASLTDFEVIAASLTLENDYWIFLDILTKGKIDPERSHRRREPIVIAGGVGVWANPWPVIPFADLILIGEAEVQWPLIINYYLDKFFMVATKAEKLKIFAEKIPGALVPSRWPEVVITGDAPPAKPVSAALLRWPPRGHRPPTSPIISPYAEFSDVRLVEIGRGCPWGCRFCLAGTLYRPHRPWSVKKILAALGKPWDHLERVGLVSPAIADHPNIERILDALISQGRSVTVSSLRLSSLTEPLARRLMAAGARGLAVAPEAGEQRLRNVINKAIFETDILGAARFLAESGLKRLKLYFMLGLPGETPDDVEAIATLCQKIKQAARGKTSALRLIVSVAYFCPKPHTPFETLPLSSESDLVSRGERLKKSLASVGGLDLKIDPPLFALIQSLLARGGAESGDLVRILLAEGGRIKPSYKKYAELSAERNKFRRDAFLSTWPEEKFMPWRVVKVAAGPNFLKEEERLANKGLISPPCPPEKYCGRCLACKS